MTNKEKFKNLVSKDKSNTVSRNRERIKNREDIREYQDIELKVLKKKCYLKRKRERKQNQLQEPYRL